MPRRSDQSWVFARLSQLPLWQHFLDVASPEQHVMVSGLIQYAAPVLDRVIETFPTYTLHNHVHAENVVHLMGELLGTELEKLSGLEAAMLILASYFHDIGMVFTNSELADIPNEPRFSEFLDVYLDAFVAFSQTGSLSPEIAERYCRWCHADRASNYLDLAESEGRASLMWGVVPLKAYLSHLCQSHSLHAAYLKDDTRFPINFLGECDLCFCGLLLRLADILDFDNSRSPESVYHLLGIERQETSRHTLSDVEWRKHLAAEGFAFPKGIVRSSNYKVGFIAGPTSPAVEYDVRHFLNIIEQEFSACSQVIRFSSEKWRDFPLPGNIDRSNIISNGYKYGEYLFSIDHTNVLNLFMGENLYDDPYVFIRELLQNAIDATRHRLHFERCMGRNEFNPGSITVTEWRDADGYQWIRVDDFGMGMDEHIINEFMLKVGKSYYESPEFQADLVRYSRPGTPLFKPISRFGIGLLSCFIVGDRMEVNTLRVPMHEGKAYPIRLSLPGLHGFYTLQSGDCTPAAMPSATGGEQ